VLGLKADRPFGDVILHALSFQEAADAFHLEFRPVHEFLPAAVAGDEAIALCIVEPLHGSSFHVVVLWVFLLKVGRRLRVEGTGKAGQTQTRVKLREILLRWYHELPRFRRNCIVFPVLFPVKETLM
jgi:hypothetical protein